MAIKKLSLLPAGRCQVDAVILDTRLEFGQQSVSLPIWVYLVETTDGPILIDTGMLASCVESPTGLFGGDDDGSIVPNMQKEDTILEILNRKGYQPGDLACVISSHLHFDHAGGNELFPNTDIVIQKAEFDAAMTEPGYLDICKRPNLNYKVVDGDMELVPGIQLLSTPGHSPGHQSVLIQTKDSGNVLLTIDASYTRENFEKLVPFAVNNQDQANSSILKLREIASTEKAKIFFGHDIGQEKEWKNQLVIY